MPTPPATRPTSLSAITRCAKLHDSTKCCTTTDDRGGRTDEPGTLQYEIYFNDDESECIVLERYRDSDALIEHGANVADLMEPILATASVSGELLGAPSAALTAQMVDGPVRLLTLYQSL
jgi:hypothetical protein